MIPANSNYIYNSDQFTHLINAMNNDEMNGECDGVYIGTNEPNAEDTFECLSEKHPAISQSCHVGFSSWFNFDIIVNRQPCRAILIDFNPSTKAFLSETLNCVVSSNDRNEFADKICQYIANNESKFVHNCNIYLYGDCEDLQAEVRCEFNIPGSWLSSDDGFNTIKKLASEGKIAIITEDIRAYEKLGKISDAIKENGYVVDTLYLSNIGKYMNTEEDKNNFAKSVNCLSSDQTKIIYCQAHLLDQEVLEVGTILNVDQRGQRVSQSLFCGW